MSPTPHDADSLQKPRNRSNTASLMTSIWRKRNDTPPNSHSSPSAAHPSSSNPQPTSIEGLIEALTPPAVPSLSCARALATLISTCSPLPRLVSLNQVLCCLCDPAVPVSVQAAGYDIVSAYFEHHEAPSLSTGDMITYLSQFFPPKPMPWNAELWDPRFKALRAITKYGSEIVGIEKEFADVLKRWIQSAFEGLLKLDGGVDRAEWAERERSVDILAKFLSEVLKRDEIIARIPEDDLGDVLQFYTKLVDRCTIHENKARYQNRVASPSETPSSNTPSTKSGIPSHKRNHSSLSSSSTSIPSSIPISSPPLLPISHSKHPADLAISLYLDHLEFRLKTLTPSYLNSILPLLFRALAFCSSPLPRLSVAPHPSKKPTSEDKITQTLHALLGGPYSTNCMRIMKNNLFPPSNVPQDSNPARSPLTSTQTTSLLSAVQTSLGAHRTFRNYVRRALSTRLARAYISRETSLGFSPSGAPAFISLEKDLMERAWPKEDYTTSSTGLGRNGWDAGRLGKALTRSVESWVWWVADGKDQDFLEKIRAGKEEILEEAAGVLKDIWQEFDSRGEDEKTNLDEEESCVIGETLMKLAEYVHPLRNPDGTPYLVSLSSHPVAPTPFLRSLSTLLFRDHTISTSPLLSTILIHISDNLTDADTARLPHIMAEQHDLYPTSPNWKENWSSLLSNRSLMTSERPQTRVAIIVTLEAVYGSVKDMKVYRQPLADMVLESCELCLREGYARDSGDARWRILGDEIVARTVEVEDGSNDEAISKYLNLLLDATSSDPNGGEEDTPDTASVTTAETPSPSPVPPPPSTIVSPTLSRAQSEFPAQQRDRDTGLPSVMSILSSLAASHQSRTQSIHTQSADEALDEPEAPPIEVEPAPSPPTIPPSAATAATAALVLIFSQMVFTPNSLHLRCTNLAIRVFDILISIVLECPLIGTRIATLQFLMRLRVDRDHKLYYSPETHSQVVSLADLIHRNIPESASPEPTEESTPTATELPDLRRPRPSLPLTFERNGRQRSRDRGVSGAASQPAATTSRSRSRVPRGCVPSLIPQIPATGPLWTIPESIPFVSIENKPSEGLATYDPDDPTERPILPTSAYLQAIITLFEKESNWEILSYLLCHFPAQLSNKHMFCGPKSRQVISKLLSFLCTGLLNGDFASHLVTSWPRGLIKSRDAHGLAFHTLSVLISYKRCFDLKQCHLLVEVLQMGLNAQFATIKCCLHALSLAAFELPSSMTRSLPRILEMLSQIMSTSQMTVHILSFLEVVGSLPPLYTNFTDNDYKMVFGVALQYLQQYNRRDSPSVSWALSQHVRILAYSVVYTWYLALKLPDRAKHIPYITRQLLLANEGNDKVDDPTEVCFDWLARYTFASADPRPAPSVFNDIIMNPPGEVATNQVVSEKTWILGYSVITIKTLARRGWVEIVSRRPSGSTRFLCRAENAPMVPAGDVNPDLFSVPSLLMIERDHAVPLHPDPEFLDEMRQEHPTVRETRLALEGGDDRLHEDESTRPDPITGYVWSGTAPSQRRKDVIINPGYIALQLSAYPERVSPYSIRTTGDSAAVSKFVTTLDRVPVIDTHKVGVMYVAPGQSDETEILRNTHGSPAYTRFLEGLGRLVNLRGQRDVYAGGLDPDEDGAYAYAWWDDISQILYHTATMMPTREGDPQCNYKKRHIGNDYVRIVWNDSGRQYRFDTLSTQFQFINIIIEPHSFGAIAAFSNHVHENEYFKVTIQRAEGMPEFTPIGHYKLISAESLPLFVRWLSQSADWFASVFATTQRDTVKVEVKTNWRTRLESIRRFRAQIPQIELAGGDGGAIMSQETARDFTNMF